MPRHLRTLSQVTFAAVIAGVAQAQTESNRYLPISSWATPYVEHLIRAGVLRGLDPLTRPLTRGDVARAVAATDATELPESVRRVLRLLAWELEERPDTFRWRLEANVATQGASDAGRWTVRPQLESRRLFYQGGLTGSVEFPHVALVTSPYFDTRLRRDTQFTGNQARFIAGDNAEAYVIGRWRYFELFFGIEPRNWGPPEVEGALLSTSPYPFDHLMVRLGPRRFRLELIATQLDTLPMQGTTQLTSRYASMHRLVIWPSDRLSVTLSEGSLQASQPGQPSRSYEPWFLDPANLWLLINANGYGLPAKDLLALDASWRAGGGVRLAGQWLLNDFAVDKRSATNPEKPREQGLTLSATGPAMRGLASWSVFYTRVDNNVYQTQKGTQYQWSVRGVGIGRNWIDYDQLTGRFTALVAPRAMVAGELTYLRQGEGDFRTPFPPSDSLTNPRYADSLQFLTGVVERTLRVAAQATWTPTPSVHVTADVGRHFVHNANHVSGARLDRWVWRLRAEVRRRIGGAIRWPD